MGRLDNTVI